METYENKNVDFKMKDRILSYRFRFTEGTDGSIMLSIRGEATGTQLSYDNYEFQQPMPISKTLLGKLFGGWVRNHILQYMMQDEPDVMYDAKFKKQRAYAYLRSRTISRVMIYRVWNSFSAKWALDKDHLQDIDNLTYRLFQGRRNGNYVFPSLFKLSLSLHSDIYNVMKKDIMRYPVAFGQEIVETLHRVKSQPSTIADYNQILKAIPEVFKKNRYGLGFDRSQAEAYKGPLPTTRWGWYAFRVSLSLLQEEMIDFGGIPANTARVYRNRNEAHQDFAHKLMFSDIGVWHYYKKAMHINGPYKTREIRHMFQTVVDGARFYREYEDNAHKVSFVPVEGSAMRMIRNAIYNHRQQQELTKQDRLTSKDFDMPKPPIKLPDWIENIRIKTAHAMITAGIECQHCIGSYTNSHDIFVREGNLCAQIYSDTLQVIQCFDVRDQITKASEGFKLRLEKALKPLLVTA